MGRTIVAEPKLQDDLAPRVVPRSAPAPENEALRTAFDLEPGIIIDGVNRQLDIWYCVTDAAHFALDLTRDSANFISAMVKLHDRNLGVADPGRWETWLFYSHPSGRDRIEMARALRVSNA